MPFELNISPSRDISARTGQPFELDSLQSEQNSLKKDFNFNK